MSKYIPYNKMSKRNKSAIDRKSRVVVSFNTGTQIHADKKHPSRQKRKKDLKKMLDNY